MGQRFTERIDGAVTTHVLPIRTRLRAARLYLATVTTLFLLVAVVSVATGAWVAAAWYAAGTVGCLLFLRRFLGWPRRG